MGICCSCYGPSNRLLLQNTAYAGSRGGLEAALEAGLDPNRPYAGCTLLHHAAISNSIGSVDTLRLLIHHGASLDARITATTGLAFRLGDTPLLAACRAGDSLSNIAYLLELGADTSSTNAEGETALLAACRGQRWAAAAALLAARSPEQLHVHDAIDSDGKTAFGYASEFGADDLLARMGPCSLPVSTSQ